MLRFYCCHDACFFIIAALFRERFSFDGLFTPMPLSPPLPPPFLMLLPPITFRDAVSTPPGMNAATMPALPRYCCRDACYAMPPLMPLMIVMPLFTRRHAA